MANTYMIHKIHISKSILLDLQGVYMQHVFVPNFLLSLLLHLTPLYNL